MLKIRLARMGKKKKPTYRFVVSDSQKDMYGRSLEILGHYDPFSKVIEVNKDRILYWISKGAQPSPTVHNLLVDQNVIEKDKVKASKGKKKKQDKEVGSKQDKLAEGEVAPEEKKDEKPVEPPVEEKLAEEPKAEEVKEEKPVEVPKEEPKVEEKVEEKKEDKSEKEEEKK